MSKYSGGSSSSQNNQKKLKNYFDTAHLKANLRQRSVRGGAVTIAAQASKFFFKIGSTTILARLLSPEDYGLIGMATVIIGLIDFFKDLGLSAATIQRTEINHKQISTLFWINLGVSCLIALIVAGLAPAIAMFYHEPRLNGITLALAANFIFGGLTVQHQALLRRQMQFTSLAKIEIVSISISVITAIVLARSGFGYWALVFMQMAMVITNAMGVWIACSWRPGLPARNANIGSMLAYGGNLTGFGVVNYFSRNLDNMLIGRYWGSQQLGLYAKAYQLLLLPIQQINNPINSVALPTLSSLQAEPEKYGRYYYKAILLITTLGMPIVALMFADADKVILLMLGNQWAEATPLFRFLIPAAFIGTFNVAPGWVYQSLGRTDRQFRIGMVISAIHAIIFLISVRWGAIGVAKAYGLSQPILMMISIIYCYRGTPLRVADFAMVISRPAFSSISAAAILIGVDHFLPFNLNLSISFFIDCLLYALLYLTIWIIIPGGKKTLLEILEILKAIKQKRAKN